MSTSDALKRVKKVYQSLKEQSNAGLTGVLGVPAVRQVQPSTKNSKTHKQHQGIGTVKMRRGSNRSSSTPVSNGDSSKRLSALSFLQSASSALSRKQSDEVPPIDDDEISDTESLNDDGLTSSSDNDDDIESAVDDDEDTLATLHESPAMFDDTVQAVYNSSMGIPAKPVTGKKTFEQMVKDQSGLPKTPGRQSSHAGYFDQPYRSDLDTPGPVSYTHLTLPTKRIV